MKTKWQRFVSILVITVFGVTALFLFVGGSRFDNGASAQTNPTPTPGPAVFDQAAVIAKLREQIKGREQEPAEKVFRNMQVPMLKGMPAGRILSIMETAFARSLGVNCTHCHTPDKWEAEDKTTKQTARDMWAMMGKINGELLKGVKNLASPSPTVNCTTCHRGQIIPATSLPMPPKM